MHTFWGSCTSWFSIELQLLILLGTMECMYIHQICMQAGVELTIVFVLFCFFLFEHHLSSVSCEGTCISTKALFVPVEMGVWGEKKEVWHSVEPLGQSDFSLNVMYPDWLRSWETSLPLTRSSCCGSLTGPTKYSHTDSLGPVLTSSS